MKLSIWGYEQFVTTILSRQDFGVIKCLKMAYPESEGKVTRSVGSTLIFRQKIARMILKSLKVMVIIDGNNTVDYITLPNDRPSIRVCRYTGHKGAKSPGKGRWQKARWSV